MHFQESGRRTPAAAEGAKLECLGGATRYGAVGAVSVLSVCGANRGPPARRDRSPGLRQRNMAASASSVAIANVLI